MNLTTAIAIIALAALMHASFQLSVSMATLLSGHSLGSKRSGRRVLSLLSGFYLGTLVMTILIVSLLAYLASSFFRDSVPLGVWAVVCGLLIGLGIAVWAFYYRRKAGTSLWIPRKIARFLTDRTKTTRSSVESFSLGLTSVIGELVFLIAPSSAAALSLTFLPTHWQVVGLAAYGLVATVGVGIVLILVGGGHKISTIQRWREQNKRFLQFVAGGGFLILGAFIYANVVIATPLVTEAVEGLMQ